jgi:carbon monoxide dehydrogenase subunit G
MIFDGDGRVDIDRRIMPQRYDVGQSFPAGACSSLKLTNEFTVAVPLERAWETLLDIPRVAGFLPGAKIEPSSEEGIYRGTMRVKVGPMVVNYKGTAQLVHTDVDEHVADIAVQATDTKGQGTASATIRNRLEPTDAGTRVVAETDLAVTGRQAQFGRGIMQDVAGRMLDDFAKRFESYLLTGDAEAPGTATSTQTGQPTGAAAPPPPPTGTDDEALDLGSVVFRTPAVQRGAIAAGVVLLILLLTRGRRR